ncbi:MAG TPA: glycosyltransferase, partial [Urbifossiella sp.]|nr:glycosyltransferase [Urbifossiella sp.]
LEAMATGLPSLATDVGGNPELVRHECEGLLFPRGDAAACAASLRRLFADAALAARLGAAARARAQQHYRLDRTVDEYFRVYCRLAGRTP